MKDKFYYKKWFVILWLIFLPPLGIFLIIKSPNFTDKGKKIGAICSAIFFVVVLLMPGAPSAESTYEVKASEITYKTEDIPAQDAVYEDAKTYTTAMSGEYVIGTAPKDLVTGKEKEFTTAQSGTYTAGSDFQPGVYDIEVVSGSGNVMGTDLNEIMGTGDSMFGDMYVQKYDNKTFKEGDTLEVSGVSVKLVPQNKDDMVITPGTYTLIAKEGGGNVIGTGINEIMGLEANDEYDMYVPQYDNMELKEGNSFTVNSVVIELKPKEDKVLVKEATEAIPGHDQTESLTSSPKGEVCSIDGEEVECSELAKYEELKANLAVSSTVTEKVTYEFEEYVCTSDQKPTDCSELVDYDNLVKQLEAE